MKENRKCPKCGGEMKTGYVRGLVHKCMQSILLTESVFGPWEIRRTPVLLLARIVVTSNYTLKGRNRHE